MHTYQHLDRPEAQIIRKRLYEAAITLVRNDSILVPVRSLDQRFALLNAEGGLPEFTEN
ncbi:MAG: hypothetical protein R3B47_16990 [Bacteroidia bacterium]